MSQGENTETTHTHMLVLQQGFQPAIYHRTDKVTTPGLNEGNFRSHFKFYS